MAAAKAPGPLHAFAQPVSDCRGRQVATVAVTPSRLDRVPRIVRRATAMAVMFLVAAGALWVAGQLGWRHCLALLGCLLVLCGLLVLRAMTPSQEFLDGVRKEQARQRLPVTAIDELRSHQSGTRALAAAILITTGLSSVAAAVWG
jgi:hypothetical protein